MLFDNKDWDIIGDWVLWVIEGYDKKEDEWRIDDYDYYYYDDED